MEDPGWKKYVTAYKMKVPLKKIRLLISTNDKEYDPDDILMWATPDEI